MPIPNCRWYDGKARRDLFSLYKCGTSPNVPKGDIAAEKAKAYNDDSTTVHNDHTDSEDYGASDNEDFKSAKYIASSVGYGDSALVPNGKEYAVPIAEPEELDEDIEYLIDTGADFDILNLKKGMRMVKRHVRRASDEQSVNSAGGKILMTEGIRAKVASWDLPNDFFLLKDSPSLLSTGKRTLTGPFTFVQNNRKNFACFINVETMHIIIFPLRRSVPVYLRRLERERTSSHPCGLYDLAQNDFRDTVGIWVNSCGQVVLDNLNIPSHHLQNGYDHDDPSVAVASDPQGDDRRQNYELSLIHI